jgi:hypothetical protein
MARLLRLAQAALAVAEAEPIPEFRGQEPVGESELGISRREAARLVYCWDLSADPEAWPRPVPRSPPSCLDELDPKRFLLGPRALEGEYLRIVDLHRLLCSPGSNGAHLLYGLAPPYAQMDTVSRKRELRCGHAAAIVHVLRRSLSETGASTEARSGLWRSIRPHLVRLMTDADHRGFIAEDPGALGNEPEWDSEAEGDAEGGPSGDESPQLAEGEPPSGMSDASDFALMFARPIPRGQPTAVTARALTAAGHPELGAALSRTWFSVYHRLFEGTEMEMDVERDTHGDFTGRVRFSARRRTPARTREPSERRT